jgi:hypothetical protein
LPTWGDKWNILKGDGPEIFTPENAQGYGEWLGKRYKNRAIIWVVGGDRLIQKEEHRAINGSLALGLRRGDEGNHLITFHPSGDPAGGRSSSHDFHGEEWLDFNMRQNGHQVDFFDSYSGTRADYDLSPTKPVIDGEPIYEGHPIFPMFKLRGHSIAADVRRPLYWNLFTGACGHTYGHHSVWQMFAPGRKPVNNPLTTWRDALEEPGANQMLHAKRLMQSRPQLTRIPDDELLIKSEITSVMPGTGLYRFVATRDRDGSYAMIYAPAGRSFQVDLDRVQAEQIRAWWFNPRNGEATILAEFAGKGQRSFNTPTPGESLDWVLVLDDAAKNYPPPGAP